MSKRLQPGNRWDAPAAIRGHQPHTVAARIDLRAHAKKIFEERLGGGELSLLHGRNSLWLRISIAGREGSLVMRGLYAPDGDLIVHSLDAGDGRVIVSATGTSIGDFRGELDILDRDRGLIRWRVWLTPMVDLLMSPSPWNLYPLDKSGDPAGTHGIVHATQRDTAMGVLYFTVSEPPLGTAFYFQNLTALNDYCTQTHTSVKSIVSDSWPGLGYMPPPSDDEPLPCGVEVSICDAYFRLDPHLPTDEMESAQLFLDSLAEVYRHLPKPNPKDRDWPAMSVATRRDLETSSKVTVEEQGYLYLRPYTSAEYPDSMVQLAVLLPLMEYAKWREAEPDSLVTRLRAGVPNFFDAKLGTMRRYLATVGDDKDPDEVDSWYLYHPLANLARLAACGDDDARTLFLRSIDFGIRVAHRFEYRFPVQFNVQTLEATTDDRKPGELGQTDVPGLYAYVMHQAFELTNDEKYLEEANAALAMLAGLGFTVGYQFNNVAWGVAACLRLFKTTGDPKRLAQADVFLASFLHNTNVWECNFGPAEHYSTFMGVTCLHDGKYMAAYEEFEAFAAFYECLDRCADDLRPASRLMMSEYCRYALSRCWCYYPGELPRHILSPEVRNGHVDCSLAIPLEDVYADWKPPGGVGQEVYGAGMAFAFVTRAYRRVADAPFMIFCDVPFKDFEVEDGRAKFRLLGDGGVIGRILLLPSGDGFDPAVITLFARRNTVEGVVRPDGKVEFVIPADSVVEITWPGLLEAAGASRSRKRVQHA